VFKREAVQNMFDKLKPWERGVAFTGINLIILYSGILVVELLDLSLWVGLLFAIFVVWLSFRLEKSGKKDKLTERAEEKFRFFELMSEYDQKHAKDQKAMIKEAIREHEAEKASQPHQKNDLSQT
jgi:hypothetical protein